MTKLLVLKAVVLSSRSSLGWCALDRFSVLLWTPQKLHSNVSHCICCLPAEGVYEEEYEDQVPSQPQPPGLPQVFGPEPIPEPQAQVPIPPPMPIKLTVPAPPKDTRGIQDRNPIPRAPVRAPPPAPPPFPPRSSVRPPAPIRTVPLPSQPRSELPLVAGKNAGLVQAPKPWVLRQEGAAETILIGCILPFEGDLRLAGNAVYHALKLAISEEAPTLLPDYNLNLTCINTKCADIPSHMAMQRFVRERAGKAAPAHFTAQAVVLAVHAHCRQARLSGKSACYNATSTAQD